MFQCRWYETDYGLIKVLLRHCDLFQTKRQWVSRMLICSSSPFAILYVIAGGHPEPSSRTSNRFVWNQLDSCGKAPMLNIFFMTVVTLTSLYKCSNVVDVILLQIKWKCGVVKKGWWTCLKQLNRVNGKFLNSKFFKFQYSGTFYRKKWLKHFIVEALTTMPKERSYITHS